MAVEKILVEVEKYSNLLNIAQNALSLIFADHKRALDEHQASKECGLTPPAPPTDKFEMNKRTPAM